MAPFNALAVTVTPTHADPLGPAVIEIGAAGARIDPGSVGQPSLDLVFETRVDPGRPLPVITTNWFGIGPEHVRGQPQLPAALDLLQVRASRFAPDVLAATYPPDLIAAVPDLAHQLLPASPHCLSTFRLNYHVWPFHSDCMRPQRIVGGRSRNQGPQPRPAPAGEPRDPVRPAPGPAGARPVRGRPHRSRPGTLHAWSAAVPLLATVPVASRRYRGLPWRMVPRRFCETIAEHAPHRRRQGPSRPRSSRWPWPRRQRRFGASTRSPLPTPGRQPAPSRVQLSPEGLQPPAAIPSRELRACRSGRSLALTCRRLCPREARLPAGPGCFAPAATTWV